MKITVHEDYLPPKAAQKAAVVFELSIPRYLQAYRNATRRIFSELGHPRIVASQLVAKVLLRDYSQLQPYSRSNARGISLAPVKKSFLQTHYKAFKMKVDLDDIVLPLGVSFS
jgi:hypothetical protein